jgi:hypothetical protein
LAFWPSEEHQESDLFIERLAHIASRRPFIVR